MAIDTANKRSSAGNLWFLDTFPTPDGTVAAVDRQHVAYLYAGISPAALVDTDNLAVAFTMYLSHTPAFVMTTSPAPDFTIITSPAPDFTMEVE
jgi:hypothetical protein